MDRLRTQESRSHDHPVAQDEIINIEMMAIDLPAPGFGVGRLPHNAYPIEIFTVFCESSRHFHDGLIESHDIARGLKSLGTQALSEHRKGAIALRIGHFKERHAVTHQRRMDIAPSTPLDRIDREESFRALLRAERAEKVFGRLFDGTGWHTCLLDRKETGDCRSVGGNSLKR